MKQKPYVLKILMFLGGLLLWMEPLYALDLVFQPRLETGAMVYSIKFDGNSTIVPTRIGENSGYIYSQKDHEWVDTMGFVGCGTTIFFDRAFVDLSAQYALNGKDQASSQWSMYNEDNEGHANFISAYPFENVKFSRADYAVSMGYALSRRLSVFVGYKWATVDFKGTYEGAMALQIIDAGVAHGRVVGQRRLDFGYEGPFVGVTHGWPVGGGEQGMLSVSLGLASLNSKYQQASNFTIRYDSINGQKMDDPIITEVEDDGTSIIKGDTLGVALGINWQGATMIDALSYSVGISGYRYTFAAKKSNDQDIRENVINFKLGLSYSF